MPGSVQSIERAAAVLRLLAASSVPLSIGEIATSLGLAKTTTHGIVRTLALVEFVEQDRGNGGRYRLAVNPLHFGASHVDVNELRSLAMNWADALAARSGEAVRLATPAEGGALVVHHVFRPDDTTQSLDNGTVLPAHATALGKVLLAHDENLASSVRSAGAVSYTRATLTDADLERSLTALRAMGVATEVEEFLPGQAAVAAPVRSSGGLVVAAVGVSGPVERLCDTRSRPRPELVSQVRDTAAAIARALSKPG